MFASLSKYSSNPSGVDLADILRTYGGATSAENDLLFGAGRTPMLGINPGDQPMTPDIRQPTNPLQQALGGSRFKGFTPAEPDRVMGTAPIEPKAVALPSDDRIGKSLKPHFLEQGGLGQRLAMILGPALMAAGGNQAGANQMIAMHQRQREFASEQARQRLQDQIEREKWDWQKKKDMRPEVRTVGRSLVSVPFEGQPSVMYEAPSDAEAYAASLGLKEGDQGYPEAMMDFVLRSNGPTAFGQRKEMEEGRQQNRIRLRSMPTYANLHPRGGASGRGISAPRPPRSTGEAVAPILGKLSRGLTLTPGEIQALNFYGGRGRVKLPASQPQGKFKAGQTATNAQGKKLRYDGQRWVPIN